MDDLVARPSGPATPGEWIRILLAEAQYRGTLTWMDLSFTDQGDSAGEPWPVLDEEPNLRGNLLKFIDGLDVRAEVVPDASKNGRAVLHAWSSKEAVSE